MPDSFGNYVAGLDSLVTTPAIQTAEVVHGSGPPGPDVPDWATAYIDDLTGTIYILVGGIWTPATGGGGMSSGHGAPAYTPTSSVAVYFDLDTGDQWNWYASAWH